MAYQKPGICDSFETVSASLVDKEYLFAKLDTAGKVLLAGAGELAIGTVQEGKAVGQHSTIMITGITKIVAGAAFNAGVKLAADAAGKARLATTGQQVVAISLQAAGAADEVVPAKLSVGGGIAA